MTSDLTSRIAELAALIGKRLDEDEDLAQDLARSYPGPWSVDSSWVYDAGGGTVVHDEYHWSALPYIARNDPARRLRDVKATRDLVAAIVAEQHDYNPGDEYYSCSQAQEGTGLRTGPTGPPGSGCADDDRAGKPCDCGRDARVARLLGIIASEWEG